ncbi:malonate--CoA ligase ACSF3, mitochondrial [Drosophila tropicalis]|uniref:malonate--CoA ligase ACSF3, mitochondrial n=1 Tax=Drosophila tropicalis TaxID=46794 RepID=UPI0035ABCE7E
MILARRRLQRMLWRPWLRLFCTEFVNKDDLIEKLRMSFIKDKESNFVVPTFKKALLFPDKLAVKDFCGEFTYFQLYLTAKRLAIQISNICGSASLSNVAFLSSNNVLWIVIQWSCWISGQVAVPLESTQTLEQLRRQANDFKPKLVVATVDCENTAQNLSNMLKIANIVVDHSFIPNLERVSSTSTYERQLVRIQGKILPEGTIANDFYSWAPAMLIYTPNTIKSPKRVTLTHRNLEVQQDCLIDSLGLGSRDCMLPIIPMNRMHTIIGSLLSVGGNVLLQNKFDGRNAWSSLLSINSPSKQRVNLFMAMPIIYKRLITEYDKMFAQDSRMVEYIVNHCKHKIRLMITAFALLPNSVVHRWRKITDQIIYEYYGTLETGLVLGHYVNEQTRPFESAVHSPGTLGIPLKGVVARLINSDGKELIRFGSAIHNMVVSDSVVTSSTLNAVIGELQIAGEDLFTLEPVNPQLPLNNVSDSALDVSTDALRLFIPSDKLSLYERKVKSDLKETYFKTGDIFAYINDNFYFLSKTADVFTVGGYKIYCADIKKVLIAHPNINDVAILGIPNKVWGHRLGVICIMSSGANVEIDAIQIFCSRYLPFHKCPTVFKTLESK